MIAVFEARAPLAWRSTHSYALFTSPPGRSISAQASSHDHEARCPAQSTRLGVTRIPPTSFAISG